MDQAPVPSNTLLALDPALPPTSGDTSSLMTSALTYKVFFAIPFDSPMWNMYQRIRNKLERKYKDRLIFLFGIEEVRPSDDLLTMDAFKEQNTDLLSRFHSRIQSCDIIISDLTTNNPNVHLELGIALTLNKNILRVLARNIVEVSTDIKGLYHSIYKKQGELQKIIEDYLEMFLKIKNLPLSNLAGKVFVHTDDLILEQRPDWNVHQLMSFRDGEVKVMFKLVQTRFDLSPADLTQSWFGISVRFGNLPWLAGYTIYVRKNGMLEVARMQDVKIIVKKQLPALENGTAYILHMIIDGSYLRAWLDGHEADYVEATDLENQEYGLVSLANFRCSTKILSADAVCRDTLNFK
jgi:hypothetical protein